MQLNQLVGIDAEPDASPGRPPRPPVASAAEPGTPSGPRRSGSLKVPKLVRMLAVRVLPIIRSDENKDKPGSTPPANLAGAVR